MSDSTKQTDYIINLTDEDRVRHKHIIIKNKVVEFTVQYETLINDKWYPVVRYDTFHGFPHKDIINPDGTKHKIQLFIFDYNQALTFAEDDIKVNWQLYKKAFKEGLGND